MHLVAAQADIDIQALSNSINMLAKLEITQTAERITIRAKEELRLEGGGSYSVLNARGITEGTPGSYVNHAASHDFVEPDNVPVPRLPEAEPLKGQLAFTLKSFAETGSIFANEPYELYKGGALVERGVTDEWGRVIVKDHQPGTRAYTVKLSNGAAYDLKVTDRLKPDDLHQRSNKGFRGAIGPHSRESDYPQA